MLCVLYNRETNWAFDELNEQALFTEFYIRQCLGMIGIADIQIIV
jgi:hypothetical protein